MSEQHTATGPISQAISNGAVQLLREYTGRGPTKARTIVNDDAVLILLADTLTKAERMLAEAGRSEMVLETRHEFQKVMREDLIALVESEVDRKVIAFMSSNNIDPDMAAEVFVLARREDADVSGEPLPGS